jgi:hypothetical protein
MKKPAQTVTGTASGSGTAFRCQQLKALVSVEAIPASLTLSGAQETWLKKNSVLL